MYKLGPPLTAEELTKTEELLARLDACRGGLLIKWWRRRKARKELYDFLHESAEGRRASRSG